MTTPSFTRYLYERCQVEYSLQGAILAKHREEALYWAYELYHSGFQEDVWNWVREIYVDFYEAFNPKLKMHLDRMYLQWKETGDHCLLGTFVGTLAIQDAQEGGKNKRFIILYKEDRHRTQEVEGKPRRYLVNVSQYPIRPDAKDLAKNICNILPETVRDAYLGPDWLYYCAETPVWASRIREGGGKVLDKRVEFENDDLLEEFYEKWGFEPDEQSLEMHQWHGIDLQ